MDDLSIVHKTSQKQSAERLRININVRVPTHAGRQNEGRTKVITMKSLPWLLCVRWWIFFFGLFFFLEKPKTVDFYLFGGKKKKGKIKSCSRLGNADPHSTVQQNWGKLVWRSRIWAGPSVCRHECTALPSVAQLPDKSLTYQSIAVLTAKLAKANVKPVELLRAFAVPLPYDMN